MKITVFFYFAIVISGFSSVRLCCGNYILPFAFYHFPMLFNENIRIEKLWGEWTDVRMDGHMEVHPCVL